MFNSCLELQCEASDRFTGSLTLLFQCRPEVFWLDSSSPPSIDANAIPLDYVKPAAIHLSPAMSGAFAQIERIVRHHIAAEYLITCHPMIHNSPIEVSNKLDLLAPPPVPSPSPPPGTLPPKLLKLRQYLALQDGMSADQCADLLRMFSSLASEGAVSWTRLGQLAEVGVEWSKLGDMMGMCFEDMKVEGLL